MAHLLSECAYVDGVHLPPRSLLETEIYYAMSYCRCQVYHNLGVCVIIRVMVQAKRAQQGFTIVELLIVIVIIGILAAITIVAYNGVQQRARASAASSALSSVRKKLELYKVDNGGYPLTGSLASAGVANGDTTYQYTSDGASYCVTGTNGNVSYKASDTTSPASGGCPGHGQGGVSAISNLATNPSVEVNTGNFQTPFNAGNTGARDTSRAYVGTASFKSSRTVAFGDSRMSRYLVLSHPVGTYAFSAWVYVNDAAVGVVSLSFEFCGASGSSGSSTTTNGTIGAWVRVSGTYTVTGVGNFCVNFHGGTNQVGSIYTDAVMIASGSTQYTYADGNSTDWVWSGTSGSSASTGPPL